MTERASPLADLLAYMASQKPTSEQEAVVDAPSRPDATQATAVRVSAPRPARAEPAQLDYFRDLWAGVNANAQLRQSQEQVPDNAGPLHSSHLVHRSLSLMRGLSPGYLQRFLAHLEALSWMDRLSAGEAGKEAPRPAGARKSARTR